MLFKVPVLMELALQWRKPDKNRKKYIMIHAFIIPLVVGHLEGWGWSSVIEHFLSMHKALSPNANTDNKKKR